MNPSFVVFYAWVNLWSWVFESVENFLKAISALRASRDGDRL